MAAIAGAILRATDSFQSVAAISTPSAFAATQMRAFASTVSGAVLMGFGTTGDVTLKNRAGTSVLYVGPNTTTVTMAGALVIAGAASGFTTLALSGAVTSTATANNTWTGSHMVTKATGGQASQFASGNTTGLYINFAVNGTTRGYIGSDDLIAGGSANDFAIQAATHQLLLRTSAGAAITINGLAVTGAGALSGFTTGVFTSTLSATGATFDNGASAAQVTIGNATNAADASVRLLVTSTKYNWLFAAQKNVDNGLEWTPSTATGGTTFTTPVMTLTQAGVFTVTGSVNTGAPSGGTAGAWKLGIRVAATVALDTTQYIQLDVGGTLYKVGIVT